MKGGVSEGLIAIVVILVLIGTALMYVAIAAGIGLALYGLFLLFRWLFIGWTKKSKADPLFTKAAKTAVKKKYFVRHDFAERYSLSDERIKFIIMQLRISGVLDGSSVLIDKQWGLHSIIRAINSEEDFFMARIQEEVDCIISSIDEQIKTESDPDILFVLESIKAKAEIGMKINYLRTKLIAIRDYAEQSDINEVQRQINDLYAQSEIIDIFEEKDAMQLFDEFESHINTITSAKVWNTNHQRIDISQDSFCDIHINGKTREVPFIAADSVEVFFYPSFIVLFHRRSESRALQVVDYYPISVKTSSFTEPPSTWFDANDATVAYHTWLHSRVNGGPDLRYKNNPSTPYYSFYKASISPIGIEVVSGSSSINDEIKKAFKSIKPQSTSRKNPIRDTMTTNNEKIDKTVQTKATYRDLLSVYNEMVAVYDSTMLNNALCKVIDSEIHMPQPSGKDVEIPYKVMLVMFIDLIKCYQGMRHPIDFKKGDSYLLPMVTNLKFRKSMTTENAFLDFMELDEVAFIYKNLLVSFEEWAKNDGSEFLFTRFANAENPEICRQYLMLMISASDYIERANPNNTTQEKKWFDILSRTLADGISVNKSEVDKKRASKLGIKISKAIRDHNIPSESVKEGTLVSILGDYQIFSTIEEKACARILRQAMFDGALSVVMEKGPNSIEGANAIQSFILSSGYDAAKAESIILDVYYGFFPDAE